MPPPLPFSALRGAQRSGMHKALDAVVVLGARAAVAGMRVIYAMFKLLPVRDKVVLMSRLYAVTSQDFAMVAAEIRRQSADTRVIILNHRNTRAWAVPAQMLAEMYHLATSRACITDSYIAAISVLRHRPTLIVVQMWHALGAIKRFGLAAVGSAEGRPGTLAGVMRMHQGYDWVITGGKRMVGPFAEAFGVNPDHVLPIGTPRVDLLLDPTAIAVKRERIHAAHPALGQRQVVLYAPTFRTADPVHVDDLLAALGSDEFDVIVALHPLDHRSFADRRGVIQDAEFTTLDWLTVADSLVTDYSAVVFDAAVLGVPTYFFAYDRDEYRARRGLILDYESEMPGPVLLDAADVVTAIRGSVASRAEIAAFRAEFVPVADGGCTHRIVALALGARPDTLGMAEAAA